MKNTGKILIALLFISTVGLAQEQRPAKERIETMKIGFLTNKLELTAEEAKVFWPVYNNYSDELEKLRKSRRENIVETHDNFDSMSNADIEKAVDNEISFRQAEMDILKKYHPQFKKVLPIRKVAKLYKAEEDFKRKLLEMIQERRGDRQHNQGEQRGEPREH